jgi:hypothetical protein
VTNRLRVVYIAGYGRSGTTVLNTALGQHPAAMGAGEITALARHVWTNNEYCACGQPIRDCSFWSAVVQRWAGGQGLSFLEEYSALQRKFESIGGPVRMLARAREAFNMYAEHTVRLFDAISFVSSSDVIVDSSKLTSRALALALIPKIDLRVIHMVRDGRAVAWSLLQTYKRDIQSGIQKDITSKSVVRSAARWSFANMTAEALAWQLGPERFLRVRYEDFTAEPASTLKEIGRLLNLDFNQIGADTQQGLPIRPGHQIAGNRLRMKRSFSVVKDDSWQAHMPADQKARFERLCGWLLRRYGYS